VYGEWQSICGRGAVVVAAAAAACVGVWIGLVSSFLLCALSPPTYQQNDHGGVIFGTRFPFNSVSITDTAVQRSTPYPHPSSPPPDTTVSRTAIGHLINYFRRSTPISKATETIVSAVNAFSALKAYLQSVCRGFGRMPWDESATASVGRDRIRYWEKHVTTAENTFHHRLSRAATPVRMTWLVGHNSTVVWFSTFVCR